MPVISTLEFGATSLTQIDRLCGLFEQTFGLELECVTAGRRAYQLAELHSRTRMVDDSAPSAFVPGVTPGDVAWIGFEGGSSDPPVVSAGGKNYPLRDAEVPPGSSGVFEDLSAGPMPSAGADRAGALSWGGRTLPIICPAS